MLVGERPPLVAPELAARIVAALPKHGEVNRVTVSDLQKLESVSHEIGHEQVSDEYEAARRSGDWSRLQWSHSPASARPRDTHRSAEIDGRLRPAQRIRIGGQFVSNYGGARRVCTADGDIARCRAQFFLKPRPRARHTRRAEVIEELISSSTPEQFRE